MNEALHALVVWAAQLSGYEIPPDAHFEVQPVNKIVMSGMACRGRENCPVVALYQDRDVIFMRDDLTDAATDHVLIHEIVHWLQHHSGKFQHTCVDDVGREQEAYHAQNMYVAQVQKGFTFFRPPQITCK